MERSLGREETYRLLNEIYNDYDSSSSSSGSIELIMQTATPFDDEIISYKQSTFKDIDIAKFHSLRDICSTGNEDYIVMEPCGPGERVCTLRPPSSKDELFYFYPSVLESFEIKIIFSDFEVDILKTVNAAPSQLRPNS